MKKSFLKNIFIFLNLKNSYTHINKIIFILKLH